MIIFLVSRTLLIDTAAKKSEEECISNQNAAFETFPDGVMIVKEKSNHIDLSVLEDQRSSINIEVLDP